MTDEARESLRKYHREYYRSNADKVNAYQRKWRKANPDKVKAYQENYWNKKAEADNTSEATP